MPLAHAAGADTEMQALRHTALLLADGTDWSRCDDHQVIGHLAAALESGRVPGWGGAATAPLRRLVSMPPAPAASPPPSAAAGPAPAAAAAPPPAADTTFGSDLDVAAMVATLLQAAQDGVPFCEECARAAAGAAA